MAYYRCLICGQLTGDPKFHKENHTPDWEVCTCGSGGHPRRCELHPEVYDKHIAELNAENG